MTKKKKEEPKFINEVGCFSADTGIERYNVKSITELEPGTIFGAIFRYERALCVLPKLVDKGGTKVIDLTGCSNTVYFEIQERPEGSIPMIFKKLDDYFVEDILTGIKFMIGDVDTNVNEKYKYVEGLNSSISKYVEKLVLILL